MKSELSQNQASKHLKEIILLFSVPIAIIVIIVAFLYIPRAFANPGYDFIYCTGYSCENRVSVDPNGKLVTSSDSERYTPYDFSLRYYDVQRDATRLLHAEEANRYQLDTTSKSPDGYILKHTSSGSGFLFWGDYQNNWSLSKGIISKPVTLNSGSNSNTFIGWVLH